MAAAADYAHCEEIIRRNDNDRWLASLFIPHDRRRHIHALYAFSFEVARIQEAVSQPLPGEIRLQWWRGAVEEENAQDAKANPVSAALLDTAARFELPKSLLLDLIDARTRDLYADRIESLRGLESYTQATCSNLFQLATKILAGEEADKEAADPRHAGIAYGITGLMRALPWQKPRGAPFVPAEILAKHGVALADLSEGRSSPALAAALGELRALARRHLDIFRARLPGLPAMSKPAYLPLSLCEAYLQRMERRGHDPLSTI
ncbi:MAG: squalene/phytoene synthase family protein, partial [Methylocapsa sp.]|nr:squalene/phytoene synthase family protein [Methylocapsa sp.]